VRLFHSQLLAGFDRRTLRFTIFTICDLLWLMLVAALMSKGSKAPRNQEKTAGGASGDTSHRRDAENGPNQCKPASKAMTLGKFCH
jgi:hypothetical protein